MTLSCEILGGTANSANMALALPRTPQSHTPVPITPILINSDFHAPELVKFYHDTLNTTLKVEVLYDDLGVRSLPRLSM